MSNPAALAPNSSDSVQGIDPFGGPEVSTLPAGDLPVQDAVSNDMTPYQADEEEQPEDVVGLNEAEVLEMERMLAIANGQQPPEPPAPAEGVAAPETEGTAAGAPSSSPAPAAVDPLAQQAAMFQSFLAAQAAQQQPMMQLLQQVLQHNAQAAQLNQPQMVAAQMRAMGLDPTNGMQVQQYQQHQHQQQLQQQVETLQARLEEQSRQAQWNDLTTETSGAVQAALEAQLPKGAEIPRETVRQLADQAARMVWTSGNPIEQAVASALAPLLPFIRSQAAPAAKPAPKPAAPTSTPANKSKAAMTATGLSGRNTAGKQPVMSLDQMTERFFR